MKIKYDTAEITLTESQIGCLKAFAVSVLQKMQKQDPEFADCWTSCTIKFDDLQPEFFWGSIKDADRSHPIQVKLPLEPA